jgi:hypothetical protein
MGGDHPAHPYFLLPFNRIPMLVDNDPFDGARPVFLDRSLRCGPLVVRAPRREPRLTSSQVKPVK